MSDIAFALSTAIKPAKKFKIDDIEYELKGVDHLSPDEESQVLALFSRHAILVQELENEKNTSRGKSIADEARKARLRVLRKLTNVPAEVAERLPLSVQVALLEKIKEEIQSEQEDDDDEPGAVDDDLRDDTDD